MSKVKFELNRAGVRELLRSPEMLKICHDAGEQALQRLGPGYQITSHTGKNRVNVSVGPATAEAYFDNLRNNSVLKAVGSVKV